jgi:hypothetical protein
MWIVVVGQWVRMKVWAANWMKILDRGGFQVLVGFAVAELFQR